MLFSIKFVRYYLVMKNPGQLLSAWDVYLSEMTAEAWGGIICTLFILSVAYSLVTRCSSNENQAYTFYEALFFVWGAFTGQGQHIFSNTIYIFDCINNQIKIELIISHSAFSFNF